VSLGREQLANFDNAVEERKSGVGDTIRKEYTDAMATAT
jgi:hypothetical protein